MMRITESAYKYFMNIYQGGNKLRGDLIIFFFIVCFFILGALVAIYMLQIISSAYHAIVTPAFCAATFPLHIYYGYYKPRQDRIKSQNSKAKSEVMSKKSITNPVNALALQV